ncbi:hypothetical protein [Streptomyces sp. NPDC059783]|uniref:hypothetical protein n=1 Tax=Streptomyces sp. NPDC059783 TaxID=3346944 RepID=UPI00365FD3AF
MIAPWSRIPMPPDVAQLPRNSAGRPVPGNVAWYELDDDGSIPVADNTEYGPHVTCFCRAGHGTPRFGEQCPQRQRQFMTQRHCGLCTKPIAETTELVFIGGTDIPYYLEPPLHCACADYALKVCPVLGEGGDSIAVAVTTTYTLMELRITGASHDGNLIETVFPFQHPAARHLGVLNFYLAFPEHPERLTAPNWLAQRNPQRALTTP